MVKVDDVHYLDNSGEFIIREENQSSYTKFEGVYGNLSKNRHLLEVRSNLAGVDQIVESTIEKPIIGTIALDLSFGILLYDRTNKYGIVGHCTTADNGILIKMLKKLENGNDRNIEYLIIPGYGNVDKNDYDGYDELVRQIQTFTSNNIILKPLTNLTAINFNQSTLSYEFAFDTSTGQFVSGKLFFESKDYDVQLASKHQI